MVDTRWVSNKLFSEVVDRGEGFFETPIEYRRFSGNLTLFCFYYIPYFPHKSRINANLSSWAKWAGSDVTACPHMISFSNGCALIPQPEGLGNVSRVIIHYFNMKWEKWSQKLHQKYLNNNKDSFVLGLKTKVGRILSLLHPLWEDSNAVFPCTVIYINGTGSQNGNQWSEMSVLWL